MAETKLVNLRVPVDVLASFDAGAKSRGRTRTAALVEFMGRQAAQWAAKDGGSERAEAGS